MKKVVVKFLVDEERLLSSYGKKESYEIDDFYDALNSEFGWLEESGITMYDGRVVDEDSIKMLDEL